MKDQGHWKMSRKPKTKKIPWRIKVIEKCPENLKTKKIPWRIKVIEKCPENLKLRSSMKSKIKVIETCPENLKQESLISLKIEAQAQRQGQEKKDWKTGLFEACLKTTYAN